MNNLNVVLKKIEENTNSILGGQFISDSLDKNLEELNSFLKKEQSFLKGNKEIEDELFKRLHKIGLALMGNSETNKKWEEFCAQSCEIHDASVNKAIKAIKNQFINDEFYTQEEADLLVRNSFIFPFPYKNIGDIEILLGIIGSLAAVCKTRIILLLSLDTLDRLKIRRVYGVHFVFVENGLVYHEMTQIGFRLQKFAPGKIGLIYKEDAPWKFEIKSNGQGLNNRKSRIGIPIDSIAENNNPISLYSASAIEKFIRYRLAFRKTIIIMPFSRALSKYGCNDKNSEWMGSIKNFTRRIKELGFDVYVNMHGNADWIETARDVFSEEDLFSELLSIQEMSIFAGLCGGVVSFRSGACDLLRYAKCDLYVLYPSNKEFAQFGLQSLSNSNDIACIKERVIDVSSKKDIEFNLNYLADDLKKSLG